MACQGIGFWYWRNEGGLFAGTWLQGTADGGAKSVTEGTGFW